MKIMNIINNFFIKKCVTFINIMTNIVNNILLINLDTTNFQYKLIFKFHTINERRKYSD